jgi:hypothetical protein
LINIEKANLVAKQARKVMGLAEIARLPICSNHIFFIYQNFLSGVDNAHIFVVFSMSLKWSRIMKKVIFLIMSTVMFSTLGASTESFKKSELSVGYVNIISNVNMDAASGNLLRVKEKSQTSFDFRVGFVDSLLEIQNRDQKSNSFFDTLAIWVSYKF